MAHPSWLLIIAAICQVPPAGRPRDENVYCGSYSLFTALKALGAAPATFDELDEALGKPTAAGYSMAQLEAAARRQGLQTLAVETSLDNLRWRDERFACLTIINEHHFVLLYKLTDRTAYVCDPPRVYDVPRELFESAWSRQALLIGPTAFVSEETVASRRAWARRLEVLGLSAAFLIVIASAGVVVRLVLRRAVPSRFVAVLFLGVAGSGCGSPTGPALERVGAAGRPALVLVADPPTRDLGEVLVDRAGATAEAHVFLSNPGESPIPIGTVSPSCGCTNVRVDGHTVPPGGSIKLWATIQLGSVAGPSDSRVTVYAKGSPEPVAVARFAWSTRNVIRTEVNSVEFPNLRPGGTASRVLPITMAPEASCAECTFEVRGEGVGLSGRFQPTGDREAAVADSSSDAARGEVIGDVVIDVQAAADSGHRRGSVTVAQSCPRHEGPVLELPVSWRVEAAVVPRPERLYLGLHQPLARLAGEFVLGSVDGSDVVIRAIDWEGPGRLLTADFTGDAAMVHTVRVALEASSGIGPWAAKPSIRTDHPEVQRIELPVAGLVESTGSP